MILKTNSFKNVIFILCSFYIAIILQMIFCFLHLLYFSPSWILLTLLYWIITIPYRLNIGTGFILGILFDFILGSTIGVYALAFSIFAYLILLKCMMLRYISIYLQSLCVIILSFFHHLMVFLIKVLIVHVSFKINPLIFLTSLIDGVVWPFLFMFMRKISYKFKIY